MHCLQKTLSWKVFKKWHTCAKKSSTEHCGKLFSKTVHFPVGKEGKPSVPWRSKVFLLILSVVEKACQMTQRELNCPKEMHWEGVDSVLRSSFLVANSNWRGADLARPENFSTSKITWNQRRFFLSTWPVIFENLPKWEDFAGNG
jgi:hypothetical protein